ncbi:2-oxoglutarate (2OG) and Fe(II)-dependent oxygenase superfamily protein [Striga asiatica]|uniref:2-oxoglutarate (2OG) and Fe(II)-dependent oxygenase superfamily protein n=1 Tax=Striga asiatica TaxID=4170 RepID=A0A5A7RLI6_STRAF|nr:2-oxoglutarate (2OG) and Fe(II)-dependent oxygenase superfamily protein [Striga asiatica]
MEILMSNWSDDVQNMPENYIFPLDKRPGEHVFPILNDIPVIDLAMADGNNRGDIIWHIFSAIQEFGFFQVINHQIPLSLMADTMNVFKELFEMPAEYKTKFYSVDISKKCRIYSSTMNYDNEEIHYWRDNFTHHCYPLEEQIQLWPEKPTRYREVVGAYSTEVRKFLLKILDFISEGLGLNSGYFDGELSEIQLLSVNHHIPCPNPSLTLGMPEHTDPNLITILHQCHVPGLQVFHNGQWMNIEPTINGLIVIPGLQLKVISNGRFSSPIHRVITHQKESRTTIGTFLIPSNDVLIQPAKQNPAGDNNDPVYTSFTYKEFFNKFTGSKCDAESTLEFFKKKT